MQILFHLILCNVIQGVDFLTTLNLIWINKKKELIIEMTKFVDEITWDSDMGKFGRLAKYVLQTELANDFAKNCQIYFYTDGSSGLQKMEPLKLKCILTKVTN